MITFWNFVRKPENFGSNIDQMKETVELTAHEKKLHDRVCKNDEEKRDYDKLDDGADDDDCVFMTSNCVGRV